MVNTDILILQKQVALQTDNISTIAKEMLYLQSAFNEKTEEVKKLRKLLHLNEIQIDRMKAQDEKILKFEADLKCTLDSILLRDKQISELKQEIIELKVKNNNLRDDDIVQRRRIASLERERPSPKDIEKPIRLPKVRVIS